MDVEPIIRQGTATLTVEAQCCRPAEDTHTSAGQVYVILKHINP